VRFFYFFHVVRAFQRIEGLSRNCSRGDYIARWMISCASIVRLCLYQSDGNS